MPERITIRDLADKIRSAAPDDGSWQVLGPSPCLIERTRNSWQWHVLVKAPVGADLPGVIGSVLRARKSQPGVSVAAAAVHSRMKM